jgi:hypothetical protein
MVDLEVLRRSNLPILSQVLPLQRVIIGLIRQGRITHHKNNCLVASNKQYHQQYIVFHNKKLAIFDHPDFQHLTMIYYCIKQLAK